MFVPHLKLILFLDELMVLYQNFWFLAWNNGIHDIHPSGLAGKLLQTS